VLSYRLFAFLRWSGAFVTFCIKGKYFSGYNLSFILYKIFLSLFKAAEGFNLHKESAS
jgi:hypothetical protein